MVTTSMEVTDVTERFTVRGMTCAACVEHVDAALRAVPGVRAVEVDHVGAFATVRHRPDAGLTTRLQQAVAGAGYALIPSRSRHGLMLLAQPLLFGALGAAGLLAFYLGIITWAQDWAHATQQLAADRWFVGAIIVGFGTQLGLFAYLRQLHRRAAVGGVAASTGTSTAAMLACCAHHLADILPVIGLSGAAVFLNDYKTPLLWLGIAMNLAGVVYLLWRIRQQQRLACALGPAHEPQAAECHATTA
jgi:copper chaperone CopZ